jgi:anaphase-promoting complex subunit 2
LQQQKKQLRFGESNLFACEAMLKDISESKRINNHVLDQLQKKPIEQIGTFLVKPSTLKTLILSEQFWPKLKDEKIEMPEELAEIQKSFMNSYETFKGNRTLIWKNNLGIVNLELELDDGQKLEFSVTPVQAAVILKFQTKNTWSLQELSQELKMCSSALRKKVLFWKMQGLIKEVDAQKMDGNQTQENTNEAANNEVYTLVTENGKVKKNHPTSKTSDLLFYFNLELLISR